MVKVIISMNIKMQFAVYKHSCILHDYFNVFLIYWCVIVNLIATWFIIGTVRYEFMRILIHLSNEVTYISEIVFCVIIKLDLFIIRMLPCSYTYVGHITLICFSHSTITKLSIMTNLLYSHTVMSCWIIINRDFATYSKYNHFKYLTKLAGIYVRFWLY